MFERRAFRIAGLSRDSDRKELAASAQTEAPRSKIVETAHARQRFGCGRVHVCCAWTSPGSINGGADCTATPTLHCRKRKKARRPPAERMPLNIATKVEMGCGAGTSSATASPTACVFQRSWIVDGRCSPGEGSQVLSHRPASDHSRRCARTSPATGL